MIPFKGNCSNHGLWENWIENECVFEIWEKEKATKTFASKKKNMGDVFAVYSYERRSKNNRD